MKVVRLSLALIAVAILAFAGFTGTLRDHSAHAQQVATAKPTRPLVFIPGVLGSRLCRTDAQGNQSVVWGSIEAITQFPTLALMSAGDHISPCGLIREVAFLGIVTQNVYGPFIERLEAAGYREGETLFVFDYDWRLSILDNAKRLAAFVDKTVPAGQSVDIVAHSMGGLIARTYALNEGGAPHIGRLISAGSPFRGSVQTLALLHDGWGVANTFMGGLDGFRRTVISFPSTFELMPDYDGCCATTPQGAPSFDAGNANAWTGLDWAGVDKGGLPDLAGVKARQAALRALFAQPLPANIEEALVIGVDQRTAQEYDVLPTDGEAQLNIRTSWDGDGTVMRDSALLAGRVVYPTSFATHDSLLNDSDVEDFVLAALASGPRTAADTVPVRKRTSILTELGSLVELVGVAIGTDQPAYVPGATAKLTVHLRLGVQTPVDPSVLTMSIAAPGGPARTVALSPDPQASDPTNPFEQSFSAEVDVGHNPGDLQFIVTVREPDGSPRQVTRLVPVVPAA